MLNLEVYMPTLVKENLTQEQFLLLFCLYRLKYCDITVRFITQALMKDYIQQFGVLDNGVKAMTTQAVKESLSDKGFLLLTGNRKAVKEISLTDKAQALFCHEWNAGVEFCTKYPARALINGVQIPLKTSDRVEMAKLYCQRIHYSLLEHKRVMLDVEYGISADLVNMSLENFIRSEQWHDIRKARLSENPQTQSVTESNDF